MIILIVEDVPSVRRGFVRLCCASIKPEPTIYEAGNLELALELFTAHKDDLDAVIMDGCVNNPDVVDSDVLIRTIRAMGFQKPVIANSGEEDNNKLLFAAGASHAFRKIDCVGLMNFLKTLAS
ncbi:MAG: hypothetical protein V4519_00085 [Patescibacteria group bacterium]